MDVRDEFILDPDEYRQKKCGCRVDPVAPPAAAGCACPLCGAACVQCNGFGGAPVRENPVRFSEVYSKVKAHVARCGAPPYPPLALDTAEVAAVRAKLAEEGPEHYVHRAVVLTASTLTVLGVPITPRGRKLPLLP